MTVPRITLPVAPGTLLRLAVVQAARAYALSWSQHT